MPNPGASIFPEYSYLIYLDRLPGANMVLGGFTAVDGLTSTGQIANYRAGNGPVNYPMKIKGGYKVNDVTLKRGVVNSGSLWNWITAVRANSAAARCNATITLRNEAGQPIQSWKLINALPSHFTGPALGGQGGNDVAIESLILSPESLQIVPPR